MNNSAILKKYLLNRKVCPKCYKNDIMAYSSPGQFVRYNKSFYTRSSQINKNYVTIGTAHIYNNSLNRRFYRGRTTIIRSFGARSYDMIELVCLKCYYEFAVFVNNSIEK